MENTALKADLRINGEHGLSYDRDVHTRFCAWKDRSGKSLKQIAEKLHRSMAAISNYTNLKYQGDLAALEEDIKNLLRREDHYRPAAQPDNFCAISSSKVIWGFLQFCDQNRKMGALVAPAGFSKTTTALEYERRNPSTVIITADLTRRSVGSVIRGISGALSISGYGSNCDLLDRMIYKLEHGRTFIIFDEAHLFCWEAFEIIRTIYDRARIGIAYLGMPRLYSQMKNSKNYLWDQIMSRLSVSQSVSTVTKNDVILIANSICPNLSKGCHDYLYKKALGLGKFRAMCELLKRSVHIHKIEGVPINPTLLKEIDEGFLI